ncbi:MAG: hypothetical protein ACRDL6_09705 [Solirubrobacterales bacterium]
MSFGEYLGGSLGLVAVAAAMAFAAVRLRGRLLPGWAGAPARLAEVVLGLSLLVVTLELIGVVGLYRPGWVLAGALIAGIGVGLLAGRPGEGPALPSPPVALVTMAVAVAAELLVAAHWAMPTQTGLEIGMYLPNTTWHNAPFAARFVQEGQVGALHFTEVLRLTVWFYPQNSELLHSAGVLFLDDDFLSPLLNIGWMSLCLLAAWSFGRPYGAGATALLGVALVLDAEMLLLYQPGDAKNDTMGLFALLAAAAILLNAEAQRRAATRAARPIAGGADGALFVAALAAGLALGTKLNLLAPYGLLTLGVIAVTAGYRLRAAAIWVAGSLLSGGFWFARNLVEAGNPLPWLDAGPLPGPNQLEIDIREPHTVADYLLPPDLDVISDSFVPGLDDSFGVLWPLVLAAVVGGFLLAIFRGRTPVVRMLGWVALFSGIAYLFTPLTAAGPEGQPTAFDTNLRYASPALGLGAMLLAVDLELSRERAQRWLLWGLAALLLVSAIPVWDLGDDVWRRRFLVGGVALAFFLILVPVVLALGAQRGVPRPAIAVAGALSLGIVVGIGWSRSDAYLEDRYRAATAPADFPDGAEAALAWFNEAEPEDVRIAVVGGRPGFKQYVFYGDDLSNHVQYVAEEGDNGTFRPIASEASQRAQQPGAAPGPDPGLVRECEQWRRAINEGDYDYVVIGPDQRTQNISPVEALWTAGGTDAVQRAQAEMVFVFELKGDLDPAGCADVVAPEAGTPPGVGPPPSKRAGPQSRK